MKLASKKHSGFTLVEMIIVISIIITLFGITLFPYAYYMERSHAENARDSLGEEWIIAHKEIRNGKIFTPPHHANIAFVFEKGSEHIGKYLLTGAVFPWFGALSEPLVESVKKEKDLDFNAKIGVISFRWFTWAESTNKLVYFISAPYATGEFYTEELGSFYSSGIFLTLGYTGASLEGGRAREILLRPYLQ